MVRQLFQYNPHHSFDKLYQARKHDRKVERVALTISLRGIKVFINHNFINHDFINHQESTYYICSLSSSSLRPWSIITRRQFSHSGTITITMTISRCSIDMVILDQQWHCLDLGGRGCYWGLYLGLFHLQVMKIVRTLCQWQRWWWKCSGCLTARRTSPTTMFLPSLSPTGTFSLS